jgi:uncharacterized protein involved in response to NO
MSSVRRTSRFPACGHGSPCSAVANGLRWLAAEPYRVFFLSGAVWSIIGVALWPLYYAQLLGFYPGFVHARLMIEAFGGAFVVGFLATAGPRMATAPKLTPMELVWLFALHQAGGVSHLALRITWGDGLFVALLVSLLLCLVVRMVKFGLEAPPPQMILAFTGLVCGITGASWLLFPSVYTDPQHLRLANLLLYQGLLLLPVLGIGSFIFPRMLGGEFGDPRTAAQVRVKFIRSAVAAALLLGSFFLEAFGKVAMGYGLRAVTATVYLVTEVRWRRTPGEAPRGSLTTGLFWSLVLGGLGLGLAGGFYAQHVAIEHLLYIGGFGLLMLVVGSRVLFGHSGDLNGFFARSNWVRFLVFLGILTAVTRATPAWVPSSTISHQVYASWTWGLLALLWLLWHRRRFAKRDDG